MITATTTSKRDRRRDRFDATRPGLLERLVGVGLGVWLGGLVVLSPGLALSHPAEAERIEILSRQIEARPDDQRLYIARAGAHSHDGRFDAALADLGRAEKLGDPVFAAFELGLLHHRRGDLAAAEVAFDRYLARFPRHARALEQRARLRAAQGNVAAAVEDYERSFAVSARPNPGSYLAAAKLLDSETQDGITPALALLDRGMERLGVIPQLQQHAIALEMKRGRTERALDRLEALEPALGDGPEWKVQMAELLADAGRKKKARRQLERASRQLESLRETPARRALAQRIQSLRSVLTGR